MNVVVRVGHEKRWEFQMLLYLEDKTVSEVNYEPQVQISDSLIMEQTPGIWEEGCGQAILLQSHN